MSQHLSAFLLAIATTSTLGLLCAILYAVRQHRREVGWLETIAEKDSQDMAHKIIIDAGSKRVVSHLGGIHPYVILQLYIFNGSVYSLTPEEKIHHRVTCNGALLPDEAEIYRLRNQKITIEHGENYQLELRQWLQPPVVEYIKQAGGKAEFGIEGVWFTYQDQSGVQRVPISIGGSFTLVA